MDVCRRVRASIAEPKEETCICSRLDGVAGGAEVVNHQIGGKIRRITNSEIRYSSRGVVAG